MSTTLAEMLIVSALKVKVFYNTLQPYTAYIDETQENFNYSLLIVCCSLNQANWNTHYMIIHSQNFVHPENPDIHMQNIERLCQDLRSA